MGSDENLEPQAAGGQKSAHCEMKWIRIRHAARMRADLELFNELDECLVLQVDAAAPHRLGEVKTTLGRRNLDLPDTVNLLVNFLQ